MLRCAVSNNQLCLGAAGKQILMLSPTQKVKLEKLFLHIETFY